MDNDVVFLCQRANVKFMVGGSTFDRKCRMCLKTVMVAPSGVQFLEKHPESVIICTECAPRLIQETKSPPTVAPAASLKRLFEELRNIVRNPKAPPED